MTVLYFALYLIGAVLFAAATLSEPRRFSFIAAGLLSWILVPLIATAQALH